VVREESHLDDMRAAIRGDFDRLAERRGEQELMRAPAEEPEALSEPPPHDEPGAPSEPPPRDEPVIEDPPRRSWLARLLGR